jgi:hypothetical protein
MFICTGMYVYVYISGALPRETKEQFTTEVRVER